MKKLNIQNIKTVKQFNSTQFKIYICNIDLKWIKYIYSNKIDGEGLNSVSQKALDNICKLSSEKEAKYKLYNSMGELFKV